MGNTASSESSADSSDKEEKTTNRTSTMENTASDESGAAFSHEAKSFNEASTSNKQVCGPSLRPEVLRRSLRERGLCVGESDLKDALAKHNTILEAIQHLVDLGVTRRNVKAQRPQPSGRSNAANINSVASVASNTREENARPPPTSTFGLAVVSKPAPKRGRQDDDDADDADAASALEMSRPRNERPLKRAMSWRPADSAFAKAFEGSGLGSSSGVLALGDVVQLVEGMDRDETSAGQTRHLETRVLLPMQPGSPPRLRCVPSKDSHKRLELGVFPSANGLAATDARRAFTALPEQLVFGRVEATMGSAVERWPVMTHEEKEEATRAVTRDLRLPPVGPDRQEMLDENLSNCIYSAVDYISRMPNQQAGVVAIAKLVRKTRKCIHETTVTIGGRYAQLYQHAPKVVTAGRKGGHDSVPEGHNEDAPDLGSPYRPRPSQGGEDLPFGQRSSSDESRASSDGRPSTFSGHAFRSSLGGIDRGIMAVSGGTSFFGSGDGRQRSPTAGLSRVFRCRAAEEAVVPEAARKVAPEEEVFWTAAGVCKEALKKTSFSRREGEWLDDQARRVREEEEDVEGELAKMLADRRNTVAQLNSEKHSAMEAMESHTKDVISAHLMPDASTEDALRSLLTTLQQGGSAQEGGKLGKRQMAINLYESLRESHRTKSTELQVVTLAVHINSVLCKALYGDLLDIISDVQQQADERRISCQNDLKCTARHVLDKLKDAINFHIKRKRTAELKMEVSLTTQAEDRRLFGDASSVNTQLAQMHINEMTKFAEDSTAKMRSIRAAAEGLWSKTRADLPEEDFVLLTRSATDFFVSEAELASAELGGSNPGGHGSAQSGAGLHDGDDCSMM